MLRHLYLFRHSFDKSFDVFYWPTVDLVLWGVTSLFISSLNPGFSQFVVMIVSGLIFWQVLWRGQIDITVGILEELWNKNIIHLFASPLRFSEWIVSFIALGIMKLAVSFSFVSILAFILYKVNIYTFGIYLVPFLALLLMSGWWIGIVVGSLILRFGSRAQVFAWSFAWAIAPLSAIYYPVSIFPGWVQRIAWFLPTSHIFEGMRTAITTGSLDIRQLEISFFLNLLYIALAILILRRSFRKILEKGLIKVY